MKLMYLKPLKTAFAVALGLVLVNTSCSKKEEALSQPEEGAPLEEPTVGLPMAFNWETSKTINIRIAADGAKDNFYHKFEIFDREPHVAGAVLLDAGLAKIGQDWEAKVTIPAYLEQVFVQKTSSTGEVSYSIIELNNAKTINASKMAATAKMSALNTNGLVRVASTTPISATPPAVVAVPANALAIRGKANITTIPASKAFVIESGTTFGGTIPALATTEGIVVYVKGKWHDGQKPLINMGKNNKIVVLPKGELNAEAINLLDGTATVENHGDVLLNSMKINSNTSFKNVGTLRVKGLVAMEEKAEFVNYQKDFRVLLDALTMKDAESVVTNNGKLEILVGTFTNGTLNANCYTTVGQMSATNATVNIWPDAKLDVTNLNTEETVYNIYTRAVLDVTKNALFKAASNGNGVIINAVGADAFNKSYVRIKYVKVDASKRVHLRYNGPLIVVTDEHPRRAENTFTTSGTTEVEIFWDRYNHPPYVRETKCNNGGVGTEPTTPGEDQKLEQVHLGAYTYLFEDNWPKVGDYDMNDLVVAIDVVKYQNKANKIEKVVLKNTIYALGAKRRLGAAIQLDNVLATAVKSVTYSNKNVVGTRFPLVETTGVEAGQTKVVVPIVDDAHRAFGLGEVVDYVFTHSGSNFKKDPLVTEITIEFATPLASFSFDDLNPFIASTLSSAPGKRHEAHLIGRPATDKIDTKIIADNLFSNGNGGVLDAKDPFKTNLGWPFAIVVPVGQFKYQQTEGKHINDAYPKFTTWAESQGEKDKDWYLFPKN